MKYSKELIKFSEGADNEFNHGNEFAILQTAYT